MSPKMMKYATYAFPVISLTFMSGFPAALQLYFVVTGICSVGQSLAFSSPYFRNILGMDPLPVKKPSPEEQEKENAKVLPRQVNDKILTLADVRRRREIQRIRYEKPREEKRAEVEGKGKGKGGLNALSRKLRTFREGIKLSRQSVWPTGIGGKEEEKKGRENLGVRRRK